MHRVDYEELIDILNSQINDNTAKKMKEAIEKIAKEDGIEDFNNKVLFKEE